MQGEVPAINNSFVSEACPTWKFSGIAEHPSYHGIITGMEAEMKLQFFVNRYLLRYSKAKKSFTLSAIKHNRKVTHLPILVTNEDEIIKYELEGTEMKFDNITDLLTYYKKRPIFHKLNGDLHTLNGIGNYLECAVDHKEDGIADHSNKDSDVSEPINMFLA